MRASEQEEGGGGGPAVLPVPTKTEEPSEEGPPGAQMAPLLALVLKLYTVAGSAAVTPTTRPRSAPAGGETFEITD